MNKTKINILKLKQQQKSNNQNNYKKSGITVTVKTKITVLAVLHNIN